MRTEREYNFDLLRAWLAVNVILVHVSGIWVDGFTLFIAQGGMSELLVHPMTAFAYNILLRFTVPCFLMLSGAFLLDNEKNAEYSWFYKKSFYKIGVPTIFFTVFYVLYRLPLCFLGENRGMQEVLELAVEVFCGRPMDHMWYLYMLPGVYLLVPVIIRFKQTISEQTFCKITVVYLAAASVSYWTTEIAQLSWNIGQSFEYTSYLLAGYVLRKKMQKNNRKGLALIGLGLILESIVMYVEYAWRISGTIAASRMVTILNAPLSPVIVLASISLYAGFSMLTIPRWKVVVLLSNHSFPIYLIHQVVMNILCKLLHYSLGQDYYMRLDCVIWIPILSLAVLTGTAILTVLYNRIYPRCFPNMLKEKTV